MNALEQRMVDVLKDLKENHHVVGVKAEFEAEGTRMEEALRLKEVITKAGLDLTIKIGGCEAIRDMYDARSIGVTRIVAPMIETPYALKKYLTATHMVYPKDEWETVDFLINVETKTGYENFQQMMDLPGSGQLKGIVLGRVDMSGSLGMSREDINTEPIFKIAEELFVEAKKYGKECVIGGGVSASSIDCFTFLYSLNFSTTSSILACSFISFCHSDWFAITSGSAIIFVNSSYLFSTASNFSNIKISPLFFICF